MSATWIDGLPAIPGIAGARPDAPDCCHSRFCGFSLLVEPHPRGAGFMWYVGSLSAGSASSLDDAKTAAEAVARGKIR